MKPATPGTVRVRREGAVARVSLDRGALNVLDRPLGRALAQAVAEASGDRSVAVLVLDGGAARGFSAGVEVADHVPQTVADMLAAFHRAVRALWACECPSIALVHGFAMGGGLELALACDQLVVEKAARLGFPEIRLGCYPPVAAAILPARIGWAAANELVLGGEDFTPERALALGMVNRICADGAREQALGELLAPLLRQSPAVLREARAALRLAAGGAQEEALAAIEARYLRELMLLRDANEGIAAFMEKRAPQWQNR